MENGRARAGCRRRGNKSAFKKRLVKFKKLDSLLHVDIKKVVGYMRLEFRRAV